MPAETLEIFSIESFDGSVARGSQMLRDGKIIILPTETVYGAAGLLASADARGRLHALRASSSAFVPHVADRKDASQFLGTVSKLAQRMMLKLWPGPVALMFDVPADRQQEVASSLGLDVSELFTEGRITLRCPDHELAREVIAAAGGPVILSGAVGRNGAARSVDELTTDAPSQVDLIIDTGTTAYSKPSTIVHVQDDSWRIVRSGIYDQRIIQRMLQTTLLFVCSGNTCRSPMAEALARTAIAKKLGVAESQLDSRGVQVLSAGTFAFPGSKATRQAAEAVSELGSDLSNHRSRPLSVELIHQADMVLAMSRDHAAAVMSLVPSASEKVALLDPSGDIDDPIGSDLSVYRSLAGKMQGYIDQHIQNLPLS